MNAKRTLSQVRAPDEQGAEERAWTVVRTAFAQREMVPVRGSRWRLALALVPALAVGVLALSPAGATVRRLVTRALGVQHAAPALSSLPSPGRLLVSGAGGTWTVGADGATRRLGPWSQASWSPRGLYIAVATANELAAIDPHGTPYWKLARPGITDARWYMPTGYRIAYLSHDQLRVVAGDGTGDHLLVDGVAGVAPAWRPDHPYQLAYLTRQGALVVRDGDSGQTIWSRRGDRSVAKLAWSPDGRWLLALAARDAVVYDGNGRQVSSIDLRGQAPASDAAISPDGRRLALVFPGTGAMIADIVEPHLPWRRVLAGVGVRQAAWSPDGRWLLVSWPAADQWVFVRTAGAPRIAAVSSIAAQFAAGESHTAFPSLEGWCCSAGGSAG